ncbi:MAG: Rieske (2Fe-2S) protein [Bacteroidetes bacterium]|nr:Rieske (2Fe-2S) protein [Bacteroidota bacterium]
MTRKEFIERVGLGASALLLPACLGGLSSCSGVNAFPAAPTNVDFTLDVSTGALATKGGYLINAGVIVARTLANQFIAVSAACTHQGSTVEFIGSGSYFYCPRHGATYSTSGAVTGGPASQSLASYKTSLNGTSLRVFS